MIEPEPSFGPTPSQTVGPFFAYALTPMGRYALTDLAGSDLATDDAVGKRIRIEGRVTDGDGMPVTDAIVEIWQPDGEGRFAGADPALSNATFKGFGRCETFDEGRFAFSTVKPGPVPGPNGAPQAPHIAVTVLARGLLRHLVTRIYFADEPANAADPALALVPAERRHTLVAVPRGETAGGPVAYTFDIRLQGEDETVFFEA